MGMMRFSISDCRFAEATSTDVCDGAHELREIFAVARGVIERVEARVHRGFGQGDAV